MSATPAVQNDVATGTLAGIAATVTAIDATTGGTDVTATSALAKATTIEKHLHGASKVYPTLAGGVLIAGGAGAWALGAFVEVVPAATIASVFDIHGICVEALSGAGVSELVLYSGLLGAEVEIGRIRIPAGGTWEQLFQCPQQLANTRISAKFATAAGGAQTVTISLRYHTYP